MDDSLPPQMAVPQAVTQAASSTVVSVGFNGSTCVNVLHTNPVNKDSEQIISTKAIVHN